MLRGSVKWFNDDKGFGFIRSEGIPEDIIVHHTQIKMEGWRTLEPGETVEFQVRRGEKGLQATNVVKIATPLDAPNPHPAH